MAHGGDSERHKEEQQSGRLGAVAAGSTAPAGAVAAAPAAGSQPGEPYGGRERRQEHLRGEVRVEALAQKAVRQQVNG